MLAKMLRVRVVLALALLAPAACANRAKQSVALYESGDYAGASRAADDGLAQHPDDEGLWGMKIRASLALGDADGIAKAYAGYMAHRGEDDKELLRDLAQATIAQAIASPSVKLKIQAIEAIAALELNDLADAVAERMDDQDDRVAAAAAVAVLKGFPDAPRIADEMLHSDVSEARRIVVDGLGKKVGKLALSDLEKAAADRDHTVRRAAVYWLGALKDKDAVEVLTKRMKDPDEAVRAAAAQALAKIGIGNLEAYAKQALADRSLSVRMAGVDLLAAAKRDDQLITLTDDKDPMVALSAAIALKASRPDLAPKAIDRAITADEWTVRAGAANMLGMAVDKATAKSYAQKLIGDSSPGVRLAAARVLLHQGDRDAAAPIFSAALTDADFGLQAATDLAGTGDKAGLDALSAATRDPSKSAEQRAAAASAHRSAHRVTPGLVAALADPNGLVRIEAAATLGALAKSK
jgi:HEAT repeat protein